MLSLGLDPAVDSGEKGDGKGGGEGRLPEHGIRTGDVVRLARRGGEGRKKGGGGVKGKADVKGLEEEGVEGVVVRVGERKIEVALGKSGGRGGGGKGGEDDESGVEALGDGKLWL